MLRGGTGDLHSPYQNHVLYHQQQSFSGGIEHRMQTLEYREWYCPPLGLLSHCSDEFIIDELLCTPRAVFPALRPRHNGYPLLPL